MLRLVVLLLQADHLIRVHRGHFAVEFKLRASVENLFRSPLGQQDRLAFRILHQDRHHASSEIEWNLIELLVLLENRLRVKVGTIQNRPVEQIFEARLEIADQVPIQEHVIGFTPGDVAMPHEDDAILRERAGLVGAQHVHPAEVLDGVEPLDDDLLAAHGERAIGEADGDDHRQHLGSEPTATARAKKKAPFQSCLVNPLMRKTKGTITAMNCIISQVKRLSP